MNWLRVKDSNAAAIVIHDAVENVAHTAKFIGSNIDEARLIRELTSMIYSFLVHGTGDGEGDTI